jgi:large subunit ribosomal protein L5
MKNKSRLQEKYEKEAVPQLVSEFGIKNKMAVPKITKVIVNMGIGNAIKNKEAIEPLKKDISLITGQLPSIRKAKISIASFGVRSGMPVGLAVTLRGEKAYSFLDRLFSMVLPRLRDFRGLSLKSFDKSGNYTLGIFEHTVFPEIGFGKSVPHGMEITIVINSRDKERSKKLLELLGMPFEKGE